MSIQFAFIMLQILYLLLVGPRYCQLYKDRNLRRLAAAFPSVPLRDGVAVLTLIVSVILLGRELLGIVPAGRKEGLDLFGVFCVFGAVAIPRMNAEIKVLESRMSEERKT